MGSLSAAAPNYMLGEQFFLDPLGPDYYVDSVTIAVLGNAPTVATVSILEDSGADSPSPTALPVASVQIALPLSPFNSFSLVTADFNSGGVFATDGLLLSGTSYWLAVSTDVGSEFAWADTTNSALLAFQGTSVDGGLTWDVYFRGDPINDFPIAAYSVSGTSAVPEPSSSILLAILLFGFTKRIKRLVPQEYN